MVFWVVLDDFSKIYVNSGYHPIKIRERHEWKVSLKTKVGFYEWFVMQFKLIIHLTHSWDWWIKHWISIWEYLLFTLMTSWFSIGLEEITLIIWGKTYCNGNKMINIYWSQQIFVYVGGIGLHGFCDILHYFPTLIERMVCDVWLLSPRVSAMVFGCVSLL